MCSSCKQGRLAFPVACLALHDPRSTTLRSWRGLWVWYIDMCFCENVRSHVRSGSGMDVGLWREGGSATALTGFQAPPAETAKPRSPPPSAHPCRGRRQIQHSIHQTNTNSHCPPLRGSQRVVQDVLVENPCLYRNHNTVDLQKRNSGPRQNHSKHYWPPSKHWNWASLQCKGLGLRRFGSAWEHSAHTF